MQIPMLTSIWRILASSLDELRAVWRLTRPLLETGYPDFVLNELGNRGDFPSPAHLLESELQAAGVSKEDASIILAIVDAYTRSNTLNMIVLTALVVEPQGIPSKNHTTPPSLTWPNLPPVLYESDVASSTWSSIHALNTFGATSDEPGLATLWRHLGHWPGLLDIVYQRFAPFQKNQDIKHRIKLLLEEIKRAGMQLAYHRPSPTSLSGSTKHRIARYVQHPGLVARMVVVGHGLSSWLRSVPYL